MDYAADADSLLHTVFGLPGYRGEQQAIISHVIAGGDAIVLMPTGGGKSLCYQLPALCRPGIGVVVSPLIALMRNQVAALRQLGINAAALNSSLTGPEKDVIRADLRHNRIDILYAAPERLMMPEFLDMLDGKKIALIAIDEAHCVSQWGHGGYAIARGYSPAPEPDRCETFPRQLRPAESALRRHPQSRAFAPASCLS
jgi:ATP-dependent DNA helicase RecQ